MIADFMLCILFSYLINVAFSFKIKVPTDSTDISIFFHVDTSLQNEPI